MICQQMNLESTKICLALENRGSSSEIHNGTWVWARIFYEKQKNAIWKLEKKSTKYLHVYIMLIVTRANF
jgi:hypothetical protein